MPTVTFVHPDGTPLTLEAETGTSLMEAAVRNGVAGIEADCGGACCCATCHVYIDDSWTSATERPGETEAELLTFAVDPSPNSRLSCQIRLTPALDGLVVRIPVSQH